MIPDLFIHDATFLFFRILTPAYTPVRSRNIRLGSQPCIELVLIHIKITVTSMTLIYRLPSLRTAPILLTILLLISDQSFCGNFQEDLVKAAMERTRHQVRYDGSYVSIPYPNGDVPETIGVCTDVVIRSYRTLGIDLQQLVHEDMAGNFNSYPSKRIWGLTGTDHNIDHRRVPNLQTFFTRHGEKLPVTDNPGDYLAGDLVTWKLPGNLPHIGIVTDKHSTATHTPYIVHNVGAGPEMEDMLFDYPITGHYRYIPEDQR
jgi:uncharacterized protein YijF (DUF1287 family)